MTFVGGIIGVAALVDALGATMRGLACRALDAVALLALVGPTLAFLRVVPGRACGASHRG